MKNQSPMRFIKVPPAPPADAAAAGRASGGANGFGQEKSYQVCSGCGSLGSHFFTHRFRRQAIGFRFALVEAKQQNPSQLVGSTKAVGPALVVTLHAEPEEIPAAVLVGVISGQRDDGEVRAGV